MRDSQNNITGNVPAENSPRINLKQVFQCKLVSSKEEENARFRQRIMRSYLKKKIKDLDKKQITVQSNDSRDEIPESR